MVADNTSKYIYYLSILGLVIFIPLMAYTLERHQLGSILGLYSLIFIAFIIIYRKAKANHIQKLIVLSIIIRLLLLPYIPGLSDDFYRFIWDGSLWHLGLHPFLYTPTELMAQFPDVLSPELYLQLNSPDYYSIYPPLHQAVFFLATWIFPDSILGAVVLMRLLIILAEIITIYFMLKLLALYQMPTKNVLLYALNPLVILEVVVNLHFEGMMIAFLLASFYYLAKSKNSISSIMLAASVAVKLSPIILGIIYWRKLGNFKSAFHFTLVALVASILLFMGLYNQAFISGFTESFSLYFQKFEFNAGFYYLINFPLSYFKGYNTIQFTGQLMLISMILGFLWYSLKSNIKKSLPEHAMWLYAIFLLFSLTVHPWYVVPLVAFCVFTPYRFPIIWSFFIFGTYMGYTVDGYIENYWLVFIEYSAVMVFLIWELIPKKTKAKSYLFIDEIAG